MMTLSTTMTFYYLVRLLKPVLILYGYIICSYLLVVFTYRRSVLQLTGQPEKR